eukprot:612166_1
MYARMCEKKKKKKKKKIKQIKKKKNQIFFFFFFFFRTCAYIQHSNQSQQLQNDEIIEFIELSDHHIDPTYTCLSTIKLATINRDLHVDIHWIASKSYLSFARHIMIRFRLQRYHNHITTPRL